MSHFIYFYLRKIQALFSSAAYSHKQEDDLLPQTVGGYHKVNNKRMNRLPVKILFFLGLGFCLGLLLFFGFPNSMNNNSGSSTSINSPTVYPAAKRVEVGGGNTQKSNVVLVAGGAGYIGSHTVVELLNAGYGVVVVDNFVNSNEESLKRVNEITKKGFSYYNVDLRDEVGLDKVFKENPELKSVIHFAGLKAVGESVQKPVLYYDNNIQGTLVLLNCMSKYKVNNIVFSSSATVYGDPTKVPIDESFPLHPTNPYGRTKLFIEDILRDWTVANKDAKAVLLRYFNPIGAHPSGRIGEDPKGVPNNVMPYLAQVAVGKLPHLNIFGSDYASKDGTGVRDYIHVVDLSKGHIAAIKKSESMPGSKTEVYNLGTGTGYSVLEVVAALRKASGKEIKVEMKPRRAGDIAIMYADAGKALRDLGWKAELGIEEMARDTWNWQSNNPKGYVNSAAL